MTLHPFAKGKQDHPQYPVRDRSTHSGVLGDLDKLGERGGVVDGEIREHFAVEVDASLLQAALIRAIQS